MCSSKILQIFISSSLKDYNLHHQGCSLLDFCCERKRFYDKKHPKKQRNNLFECDLLIPASLKSQFSHFTSGGFPAGECRVTVITPCSVGLQRQRGLCCLVTTRVKPTNDRSWPTARFIRSAATAHTPTLEMTGGV